MDWQNDVSNLMVSNYKFKYFKQLNHFMFYKSIEQIDI